MSKLEYDLVEGPLLEQLQGLGWSQLEGDRWDPAVTERASFRDVLLEQRLREALRRINLDDIGEPWLDDGRISQTVSALAKSGEQRKLVEANQEATELLLKGTAVPGIDGWAEGRSRQVHFIDWENLGNNDFLAVNQYRVDEPGGQSRVYIVPDVVLFVNGIPLVVIECKAPGPEDAVAEAINQLRRYANQRHDVEANEGNEQLFWPNQFMVATDFHEARVGSFTAGPEHFLEWNDTEPVPKEDVAAALSTPVERLSNQELLVAGMLRPVHLLDLVRHFCIFDAGESGKVVKKVARYQQFRAVHRAVERLKTGKTKAEDGESDQRGGVIWHTQGSGKSLTMVFLVRKMRTEPLLRRFKVVAVTDRTALQTQLSDTAALTGERVWVGRDTKEVKELLSRAGPELVMVMIQKYQDEKSRSGGDRESDASQENIDVDDEPTFDLLNFDEAILVLVDEAHRSHSFSLHANLSAALPNAAKIGFTGTPIIMGAKKRTKKIFGPFLDTYKLTESEADGSTVPILYEGWTTSGAVKGASDMDELVFDWFEDLSDNQRDELQRKHAGVAQVLESKELIAAKARNMLRHYVAIVLPQRFKGMVVASSRRACVRYREAFLQARDELVIELDDLDPSLANLFGDAVDGLPSAQQLLVRALPHLELLREMNFVPVMSPAPNDPAGWEIWTDQGRQKVHAERFAMTPLGAAEGETDPTAMLIVNSMLLTGFDAPNAQVLYLDRAIKEAELLQAIARVNRTAPGKDYGLVVDYYGVVNHLAEALAAYTDPESGKLDDLVEGSLRSLGDEIGRLDTRHARVRQFFTARGVDPSDDPAMVERCVELLQDPELRARFDVDLKRFFISLDAVLPRPEARPYVADAKLFGRIQVAVRRRYRDQGDGGFNPTLYREKVRQLIDEHVTVVDLTQKIPPVRITDADFAAKVAGLTSDRARASEMEHAARYHIRTHLDEDPVRYQWLSERLDEILEQLDGKWEQLALALDGLIAEMEAPRPDDGVGLDPSIEGAFHGVLADGVGDLDPDQHERLVELTRQLVEDIRAEIGAVGFWSNAHKQDQLRRRVKRLLDRSDIFPSLAACDRLAAQLVDLAKHNHHRLVAR